MRENHAICEYTVARVCKTHGRKLQQPSSPCPPSHPTRRWDESVPSDSLESSFPSRQSKEQPTTSRSETGAQQGGHRCSQRDTLPGTREHGGVEYWLYILLERPPKTERRDAGVVFATRNGIMDDCLSAAGRQPTPRDPESGSAGSQICHHLQCLHSPSPSMTSPL
ncbi:hypothetical protein SprV_0602147600 [Sparganum proliferum]